MKHLAALVTSEEAQEHARLADVHPPVLHTHDRYGNRIDEVEFHPSWHWLMRRAVGSGLHGTPWAGEPGSGAHVARAAGFYLMGQLESGHCCPISMTYAAVPALRHDPALAAAYEPGLRSTTYAFGLSPPATKPGLLAGHVDDREAGRLGRAREHHARGAVARRHLPAHRAQVVHLGPDERPVPHAGPGARTGSPASSSRVCCPTAPATASGWCA